MRLDFALLADDAAVFGGKFYIHGGGVTRISAPQLPWTHPRLALCLSFKTERREDLAREYTLRLTILDPDGVALAPPAAFGFQGDRPSEEALPGEDTALFLMLSLSPLVFNQEGVHRLVFGLDELNHELPLPVKLVAPDEPAQPPT